LKLPQHLQDRLIGGIGDTMAAPAFARTSRALGQDRGRRSRLALGLALALFALWLGWFLMARVTLWEPSRSARLEVTSASRGVVAASGGRLIASGLYAGRRVRAGEVLARFDAEGESLALAAAEARLAALPRRLAALRQRLAAAGAAHAGAERQGAAALQAARDRLREAGARADAAADLARRQAGEAEAGTTAPIEARRAEAEATAALAARDAHGADAAAMAGEAEARAAERSGDVAAIAEALALAEAEQAAAVAEVARLHLALDQKLVRAPTDGVIGEVAGLHLGDAVPAGARLATLVPAGALHVTAAFDAARGLGRLAEGQPARLRLDGFSWAQYGEVPARVERVAAEGQDGLLRVDLALLPGPANMVPLRHGMSGAVEVATERVSPAMLVLRAIGRMAG
jgi:membrane fusion protein (multidrug efflux system)